MEETLQSSSSWSSIPLLSQVKGDKRNVDKRKVVPPKNVPQILFPDLGQAPWLRFTGRCRGGSKRKSRTGTQVFDGKGMDLVNPPIFDREQVEIHPQVGAFLELICLKIPKLHPREVLDVGTELPHPG